ncbi:MAG: STY4851/ECs_5259 family protein [Pseudomonadales bacterium]|nr:STY4851/ECs_5259 family protein [Pseudomonadales bacterium]
MTSTVQSSHAAKAWLSEFLLSRGEFKGPNGQPLYSYQVTQEEFEQLQALLLEHREDISSPARKSLWAACFCLYVSERFRRDYDASEGGWSWTGFENKIKCEFNPSQRKELVTLGLGQYWKRPIKQRKHSNDYLGSLFAEGGLPWKLVQSDTHGFGRAVRGGLKQFYKVAAMGRTLTDLMADYECYFPKSFQTLETKRLLAGIVEQLMFLVDQFELQGKDDPAAYLDSQSTTWRNSFPIPITERNGKVLINDWLKDAERRRSERKVIEAEKREFTCEHHLSRFPFERITSHLFLPKLLNFSVNRPLVTSRLEIGYYEGDTLLAKGGVVYGTLEGNQVTVRFGKTRVALQRKNIESQLRFKLLESGNPVYQFYFDNSDLHFNVMPLVFEEKDGEWIYVSSYSCAVNGDKALVHMPDNFIWECEKAGAEVERGSSVWFEAYDDVNATDGDDLYNYRLNLESNELQRLSLSGECAFYRSLPTAIYYGKPKLVVPEHFSSQRNTFVEYVNGQSIEKLTNSHLIGSFWYSVKNAENEVILRRRYGVLPKGFDVSFRPATSLKPAQLIIDSSVDTQISIERKSLRSELISQNGTVRTFSLFPEIDSLPTELILMVGGNGLVDPIELSFPYPYEGATLIDGTGELLKDTDFYINELIGKRLSLVDNSGQYQQFTVGLELIGRTTSRIQKQFSVQVGSVPVELSLFAYESDILQMLATRPEQDDYIRLSVYAKTRLPFHINIRRYNGHLKWNKDNSSFEVASTCKAGDDRSCSVSAMLLSDPSRSPIKVDEVLTEGVGTEVYKIDAALNKDGPWLIYPKSESCCQFRPELYCCSDVEFDRNHSESLHQAARIYHPIHAPGAIEDQIDCMANDLDHSGWQYLEEIKSNFSHLPLSTFECWKALIRNHRALAFAVFRLEFDFEFCERISNELAILWESIPLSNWVIVNREYGDWLKSKGLPDKVVDAIVSAKKDVLPTVMPCANHLGSYLVTGNCASLRAPNISQILPIWYQDLRRDFPDEGAWPNPIGKELWLWVKRQQLPEEVINLSLIKSTSSVAYLPIFMAYVSVGLAQLEDLDVDVSLLGFAVRLISEFEVNRWYQPVHSMMTSYLLAKH